MYINYSYIANYLASIVQQGMNHDKPYFSNMSGIGTSLFCFFFPSYFSFQQFFFFLPIMLKNLLLCSNFADQQLNLPA